MAEKDRGAQGGEQRVQVLVYMDKWHIASSWNREALCGYRPVPYGKRVWSTHAPMSIQMKPEACCEVCYA